VDVLDRLDEVRLAEDEVGVVGLLDLDGLELLGSSFRWRLALLGSGVILRAGPMRA